MKVTLEFDLESERKEYSSAYSAGDLASCLSDVYDNLMNECVYSDDPPITHFMSTIMHMRYNDIDIYDLYLWKVMHDEQEHINADPECEDSKEMKRHIASHVIMHTLICDLKHNSDYSNPKGIEKLKSAISQIKDTIKNI